MGPLWSSRLCAFIDPISTLAAKVYFYVALTAVVLAGPLHAGETAFQASSSPNPGCKLRVELVDANTGEFVPGVIRVIDSSGKPISIEGLMGRGFGYEEQTSIHTWHILTGPSVILLPSGKFTVQAFSGLEYELGEQSVELTSPPPAEGACQIALQRFLDAHGSGLQNGNTHVHLKKTPMMESLQYLVDASRADGLELVYISFLERVEEDLEYTSNKMTIADLKKLSRRSHEAAWETLQHPHPHTHPHTRSASPEKRLATETEFDNGQEHRHNFEAFGEGYGHVMFLHIPEYVQPASIGPGIMKRGTDSPPLAAGMQLARNQGSTAIWCHNNWGLEAIPSWLAGRLHANNIFDGGVRGSYKHTFYRYLNAGLKVPFSTGTDWFIYDFARVYVVADPGMVGADKFLSSEQWLDHLARGRSFITNGPVLEFTVNGQPLGDTLQVEPSASVHIHGRAVGRCDFGRIELIRNGTIHTARPTKRSGGHYEAQIEIDLEVSEPCWLALRTPAPSDPEDAELQAKTPLNEYGCELFAHTSAIYIDVAHKAVFDRQAAKSLLQEMQADLKFIGERGLFSNDAERQGVNTIYEQGIATLQKRIQEGQ